MNPLQYDLDQILTRTPTLWPHLRNAQLFITGGTGFFGTWLLEAFVYVSDQLALNAHATVLTRNPARFAALSPHLANHPAITLLPGDIRTFELPQKNFTHVIHAASEVPATSPHITDPSQIPALINFDTALLGTRRVLTLAARSGCQRFLLTSSGAVYGQQPHDLTHVPETYRGAPDYFAPHAPYSEGKRVAELLTYHFATQHKFKYAIARCFAFVGPHLPVDQNFAAADFLQDALHHRPIRIAGDGTPHRSYLYAADLTTWLYTLLLTATGTYNVGSDEDLSIAQLAQEIASFTNATVHIATPPTPGTPPARYVPNITRAKTDLNLHPWTPRLDALQRTFNWYRAQLNRAGQA